MVMMTYNGSYHLSLPHLCEHSLKSHWQTRRPWRPEHTDWQAAAFVNSIQLIHGTRLSCCMVTTGPWRATNTPIEPKKASLRKGPDNIAVKKTANFPQDTAKARVAKLKDPAVLVNLPTSPSAQAYECAHAQTSKDPGNDSYFDPVFVDVEDSTTKETDDGFANVTPQKITSQSQK
ncbi:uncharacterized protein LAJ45_11235 [Morchella importuna]|uniref:uncharacterized protein n=1 Tax=Morchella importuna TaxID=1174673 RepID=UPI001E8E2851|nr:uncharacterized protein LAJ45_11235 [Morchella importuna]KAH8144734.1 hypothetical protein LAJ45_11235 [Morchella importuna]